jgi:hypothetical protein
MYNIKKIENIQNARKLYFMRIKFIMKNQNDIVFVVLYLLCSNI